MHSETFLQALDDEDVARIIQYPNIQNILTKESVYLALTHHPNLPAKLSPGSMEFGTRFLTDQEFLSVLPCEVYMNAAQNTTLVNDMDPRVLQAFSSNEHFWACLPIGQVCHQHLLFEMWLLGGVIKRICLFCLSAAGFLVLFWPL